MTQKELFEKIDKSLQVGTLYEIPACSMTGAGGGSQPIFKYLGKVGEGKLFHFEKVPGGYKATFSALQLIDEKGQNRIFLPGQVPQKKNPQGRKKKEANE